MKKTNKQTKKINLHTRQRLACQHSDLLKGGIVQKQWIHSSTSRAWRSENNQMKKKHWKNPPKGNIRVIYWEQGSSEMNKTAGLGVTISATT